MGTKGNWQKLVQDEGCQKMPETKSRDPGWLKKFPNITRKQAMDLFCHECMGYAKHRGNGISETWINSGKEVALCTDLMCPLFKFRPGAKKSSRIA